jgi:hypothetical protein
MAEAFGNDLHVDAGVGVLPRCNRHADAPAAEPVTIKVLRDGSGRFHWRKLGAPMQTVCGLTARSASWRLVSVTAEPLSLCPDCVDKLRGVSSDYWWSVSGRASVPTTK